ncbi:hypothetical protein [Coleofasciculus chthonoplastes]|uniref:hypothetical protein n=1 Tax=Coleofasciculus chthonoplastes TaxID=64178 RepID=UPI0032F16622
MIRTKELEEFIVGFSQEFNGGRLAGVERDEDMTLAGGVIGLAGLGGEVVEQVTPEEAVLILEAGVEGSVGEEGGGAFFSKAGAVGLGVYFRI